MSDISYAVVQFSLVYLCMFYLNSLHVLYSIAGAMGKINSNPLFIKFHHIIAAHPIIF